MGNLSDFFSLDQKPNLTIAVNLSIEELQKIANWIVSEYQLPRMSLNKELSQFLISKQKANYAREIVNWISKTTTETLEGPILMTEIEILFEPNFELDPLAIFRQASRNKSLVVLWPGEIKNKNLSYASPEHAHYKSWADPGVEIIHV